MENKDSMIDPSEVMGNARNLRQSLYSPKKGALGWRWYFFEIIKFVLAILAIGIWALFFLLLTI